VNKIHQPLQRRTFLRGLGATLAIPYLEIMSKGGVATAAEVAGQGAAVPTRLLCLFQPNGVYPKAWDVKGTGMDYGTSPILEPLSGLREEVSILSGLDNSAGGGHVNMTGGFLSGRGIGKGKGATSLDQMVAQKIGQNTAFQSLVLGTEPPRQGGDGGNAIAFANTVSWSSPGTRISPEINPRVAFDRLFRTTDGPEARKNAELRKSVVDLVLDDAKGLRRKASLADQHKIDDYLDSVRALEKQIDKTLDPPERDWTPPTRPGAKDMVRPPEGIPRSRDEHLRMMMDILVLSLWTDSTRVGTLMTAHGFSRQNFSFLEGVTNDHHGMSHHKEQKGAVEEYTKVSHWYIRQFAYLLERMRSIDEGHGTLLDNSVVLYGSGMKDGNGHKRENLPILMAGRGGGKIVPRGHLKLKSQPLANLHLTIAQKFGIESDDFNGVGKTVVSEIS
jgi:hypothetical protein